MAKRSNDAPDYEVGYKRPPKAAQYRKGECGNPDGRPPKILTLTGAIEEMLNERVTVPDDRGRPKRMQLRDAVAIAMVNGGLKGDIKMTRQIIRLERDGHLNDPNQQLVIHVYNGWDIEDD